MTTLSRSFGKIIFQIGWRVDGWMLVGIYGVALAAKQMVHKQATNDRMVGPSDKADIIDPDTGEVMTLSNAKIQAARIAAGGWQVRYVVSTLKRNTR